MDPAILLIIVFIVAPLIERLLKAGRDAQQPDDPPQQRMPPQRPPQHRIPQRTEPQVPAPAQREDEAAAAMLPDDLWEILTGERRTPAPAHVPQPDDDADEYEDEEMFSLEDEAIEEYASGDMLPAPAEPVSLETYVRPLPEREAPRVVSLEQLEFDDRKRHDEFHDRLDNLRPAARVRRPAPNSYRFTTDEDLRRAIIMNEILGPPKGLQ